MKKKLIYSLICLFFGLQTYASAHSGRTDANGCHSDNIHGGYHCHNGGSEEVAEDDSYERGKYDGYYEGLGDATGIDEENGWDVTGSQEYINGFKEGYDEGYQQGITKEETTFEENPNEEESLDYIPEYTPENEVDPGEDKVIDVVNKKPHVEQPSFFEKHSKGISITVICVIIIVIYIKRKR